MDEITFPDPDPAKEYVVHSDGTIAERIPEATIQQGRIVVRVISPRGSHKAGDVVVWRETELKVDIRREHHISYLRLKFDRDVTLTRDEISWLLTNIR